MNINGHWRTLMIAVALAAGTSLLYSPVSRFDFVNYDDPVYVTENVHVNRGVTLEGLAWSFQAGYASNWHPLTWMSHSLDCQWWGLNPSGPHLVNVVLHAMNAVMLFIVLQRMTKAPWRSAFVAAFFAWHPLRVESAAWISERKDVLSGLFWMLTLWAYALHAESGPRRKIYYAAALLFFTLGLMAKPMLVTLPLVMLLLDWWPLRRWEWDTVARTVPALVVEKIPFFLLAAGSCALTLIAQNRGGSVSPLSHISLEARGLNSVMSYYLYIQKTLWPTGLAVLYPFSVWTPGLGDLKAAACLGIITTAALMLHKTRPFWLVGWLWYVGTLVPVIGLVQVGGQSMADRYTYLPCIGLALIFCWEAGDIARDSLVLQRVATGLGIAALTACVVLTVRQLGFWKNSETLMTHTIAVTQDNYIAHANYAMYLSAGQRWNEAAAQCEASLRIVPQYPWAHQCLGQMRLRQGRLEEACAQFSLASRLAPQNPDYHLEFAVALAQCGHTAEAGAEFRAALALRPGWPVARDGLARILARESRPRGP